MTDTTDAILRNLALGASNQALDAALRGIEIFRPRAREMMRHDATIDDVLDELRRLMGRLKR